MSATLPIGLAHRFARVKSLFNVCAFEFAHLSCRDDILATTFSFRISVTLRSESQLPAVLKYILDLIRQLVQIVLVCTPELDVLIKYNR